MESTPPLTSLPEQHYPAWIVIVSLLTFPFAGFFIMYKDKKYHSWFAYILWISALLSIASTYSLIYFVVPQLQILQESIRVHTNSVTIAYSGLYLSIAISGIQILVGIFLWMKERHSHQLSKTYLWLGIIMLTLPVVIQIGIVLMDIIVPIYTMLSQF